MKLWIDHEHDGVLAFYKKNPKEGYCVLETCELASIFKRLHGTTIPLGTCKRYEITVEEIEV